MFAEGILVRGVLPHKAVADNDLQRAIQTRFAVESSVAQERDSQSREIPGIGPADHCKLHLPLRQRGTPLDCETAVSSIALARNASNKPRGLDARQRTDTFKKPLMESYTLCRLGILRFRKAVSHRQDIIC